jgi:hypothetical protein
MGVFKQIKLGFTYWGILRGFDIRGSSDHDNTYSWLFRQAIVLAEEDAEAKDRAYGGRHEPNLSHEVFYMAHAVAVCVLGPAEYIRRGGSRPIAAQVIEYAAKGVNGSPISKHCADYVAATVLKKTGLLALESERQINAHAANT